MDTHPNDSHDSAPTPPGDSQSTSDTMSETLGLTRPKTPFKLLFLVFPLLILSVMEHGIALPIMAPTGEFFEATPVMVGLLFSIQYIGQFVTSPLWGWLSDRFGRKSMLIAALITGGLAELLTAFSPNVYVLLAGRLLVGLTAGNIAIGSALMSDMTTEEDRSKGMALVGISYGLGFVFGAPIGGVLRNIGGETASGFLNLGLPFVAAGIILFLCAILSLWMVPNPSRYADVTEWNHAVADYRAAELAAKKKMATEQSRRRDNFPFIAATLMCILYFVYTSSISMIETRLTPILQETYSFSAKDVGKAFAGVGIVMLVMQGSVSRISKYFKDYWLIAVGGIVGGLGYLLASQINTTFALFYAFICFACMGRGVFFPGVLSQTSKCYDSPKDTGRVMGFLNSSGALGRILGPLVAGYIVELYANSPFMPFMFAGGAILIVSIFWSISWFIAAKAEHHDEDLPTIAVES